MEEMMNKELMEALDILEKEKEISKETLFDISFKNSAPGIIFGNPLRITLTKNFQHFVL